jgi:hypothetical protein
MAGVTPAAVLACVEGIMQRPWDWRRDWNCLGDAADVFRSLWGVDPVPGLRGLSQTFGGARRLVRGAGGMVALVEREFRTAGLVKGAAVPGAIGIGPTLSPLFDGVAAIVCVKPTLWAGKSARGFTMIAYEGEGWVWPR